MFYFYEKLSIDQLMIEAHIEKSFRTQTTPALKIISSGIKFLKGKYSSANPSEIELGR